MRVSHRARLSALFASFRAYSLVILEARSMKRRSDSSVRIETDGMPFVASRSLTPYARTVCWAL